MNVSAKVDYAMRALLTLAAWPTPGPVKGEMLAREQDIPLKFLENILIELRRSGIVRSQRGSEGGYWLARPADQISVADVIRAVEGPLAEVRGIRPEVADYHGPAAHLNQVWVAMRASLRLVLEPTSLADIVAGTLPAAAQRLMDDPEVWLSH